MIPGMMWLPVDTCPTAIQQRTVVSVMVGTRSWNRTSVAVAANVTEPCVPLTARSEALPLTSVHTCPDVAVPQELLTVLVNESLAREEHVVTVITSPPTSISQGVSAVSVVHTLPVVGVT